MTNPLFQQAADKYKQTRDERAALKEAFEAKDKEFAAKLDSLEKALLGALNEIGAESIRVDGATIYRQIETKPIVDDWKAYTDFIFEQKDLSYVQKRVSKSSIDDYARDNGKVPPGISLMSEYVIRVRKS